MCKISNGSHSEPYWREEKTSVASACSTSRDTPYRRFNRRSRKPFGISGADIKGALRVLADVVADRLEQGYNVEVENFGFLSVSLSSRPVMDKKEIRSESIHFKNVNFRCGKYLKSKLKTMDLERMPEGKGVLPPFGERVRRLMEYLEKHHYITCSDYRELTGCSKYRALEDLKKLIDEGKLEKNGYRSTRVYSLPSSEKH